MEYARTQHGNRKTHAKKLAYSGYTRIQTSKPWKTLIYLPTNNTHRIHHIQMMKHAHKNPATSAYTICSKTGTKHAHTQHTSHVTRAYTAYNSCYTRIHSIQLMEHAHTQHTTHGTRAYTAYNSWNARIHSIQYTTCAFNHVA